MIKKYLILINFIIAALVLNAQTTHSQWTGSIGGIRDDMGSSIAVDADGNTYTTGYFKGTCDFDPGSSSFNLTSSGNYDIFVFKLDTDGNFIWALRMGGISDDYARQIKIDEIGNIYVVGTFSDSSDFDPGADIFRLISSGLSDIFIVKLTYSGGFVWAKSMGGVEDDFGTAVAIDPFGNIYTSGGFSKTADFDPNAGKQEMMSSGAYDVFVSKLSASGNFIWARKMGGTINDYGRSLAIDSVGNILVAGQFWDSGDFDPGSGSAILKAVAGCDIFVLKLDVNGIFNWAVNFGGNSDDIVNTLCVDISGNIYISGNFSGTVDFNPGIDSMNLISSGYYDFFVLKLNNAGKYTWVRKMGGTDYDYGYSMALDAQGNIYTTGYFHGYADFDPDTSMYYLSSLYYDAFVSKLDASGKFVWANKFSGMDAKSGLSNGLDSKGNLFTMGYFNGSVDFDFNTGVFDLTSAGKNDVFVNKISQYGLGLGSDIKRTESIIYPNPNNGDFIFKSEVVGTYSITNELGQEIRKFTANKENNYTVIITGLNNGAYILSGLNNRRVFTFKIIVIN